MPGTTEHPENDTNRAFRQGLPPRDTPQAQVVPEGPRQEIKRLYSERTVVSRAAPLTGTTSLRHNATRFTNDH
jgi:hypothetical protein